MYILKVSRVHAIEIPILDANGETEDTVVGQVPCFYTMVDSENNNKEVTIEGKPKVFTNLTEAANYCALMNFRNFPELYKE